MSRRRLREQKVLVQGHIVDPRASDRAHGPALETPALNVKKSLPIFLASVLPSEKWTWLVLLRRGVERAAGDVVYEGVSQKLPAHCPVLRAAPPPLATPLSPCARPWASTDLQDRPEPGIEDPNLAVFTGGGQQAAVGVERHGQDHVLVAGDGSHGAHDDRLLCVQVPDHHLQAERCL